MAQHILPKGFQRIRYYGLHRNVRYQKMRELVGQIIHGNMPANPRGYRVLQAKPFQQRFFESFSKDHLLCPNGVEDIVVDAFPPTEPGGFPEIVCPECGGSFLCDTAEPVKSSRQHPDHIS